ncbi:protein FAM170A isoform X2 [Oryctolagus cuniculus]|uniref:protein FAM170A isoform X2 n=1 Tax=Oryctolagus cuniculus TaxID=9986 RepID=UPI00048A724C|nr:protein FAM170A isoform X1 [Oryctolagus cuniculus]
MKRKQKTKHLETTCPPQASKRSRGSGQLDPGLSTSQPTGKEKSAKRGRGVSTTQLCEPQSRHSREGKTLVHEAKGTSDELECYIRHPSSANPPRAELQKPQEDASASCVEVAAHPKAAGESSVSDDVSCVSPLNDPVLIGEDEMYEYQPEAVEMPLLQDVRQQHRASPCPRPCFHFHLADEPCTPATHRRKQRAMKVFYMRVRRKRGGNVVWDSQEGLVPPRKRTKVEEIAFPGTMPAQPNLSYQSTEDLVTEDSSCFMGEQEQVQEAASYQAAPPAEEGMPQAQASTPEWQLSPRRGFKCMACCRVFSSLADLQEHVQHGAKEGFSCRVFHLAFAWLESKKHMLEKRDNKKTARKTSGRKKEKHLDAGKSPRQ